jgi:hypothetical protein
MLAMVTYGTLTRDVRTGFLGVDMSCARVGGGAASMLPIKPGLCRFHEQLRSLSSLT